MQKQKIRRVVEEVEGWLSLPVATLLYRLAKQQSAKGPIVEIGAYKGKSTVCIAMAIQHRVQKNPFYSIDPHTGSLEHTRHQKIDTYNEYLANLKKHSVSEKVTSVRKTSQEAFAEIPSGISMLWIDGSHEYEDVLFDFEQYFEKLKPGGVVAFHDSNWPGVKKVLWEKVYPSQQIGFIRKIEQTTFFFKKVNPIRLWQYCNFAQLLILKKHQSFKRIRRKWRRRFPALASLL